VSTRTIAIVVLVVAALAMGVGHHVLIVIVLLVVALAAAAVVRFRHWSVESQRHLPRHRSRHLRLRLRLRMHPGAGHATGFELWRHWGRFASFRESRRTRPSLSRWQRLRHPAHHSFYLGRAHHGRALRVPVQEHGAIIGPPRSYKSALLTRIVMDAPGAVVSTSSKADVFTLTSGIRAQRGPVWVFNPQAIGGVPSNVRWSPLDGCLEPSTAIRRADAFAQAVSTAGAEDASFWSSKASDGLRGMFAAAARVNEDLRRVSRWIGSDTEVLQAVAILDQAALDDWAVQLAELAGQAEKTAATVRMVMSRAMSFLRDPQLLAAVTPDPGEAFDIDEFLLSGGTLYLLARNAGDESPLAPLFAALASEIQFRATQLGSRMPGGRLDPPLTMALDEITQICPVPLPAWLADSGGQGISIWSAFHGFAQLRARWRESGAQTVLDTSNVRIFLPGLADTETLDRASKLCGQAHYQEHGSDAPGRHDVMTPAMIRQMPAGFALVIRNGLSPVIARLARGWEHRQYKRLRRHGQAVATVAAPTMLTAEVQPVVPVAGNAPADVTADRPLVLMPAPAPEPAHSANGNGHRNGAHPWSAK
jgi:type IV secretion system protein VirD4